MLVNFKRARACAETKTLVPTGGGRIIILKQQERNKFGGEHEAAMRRKIAVCANSVFLDDNTAQCILIDVKPVTLVSRRFSRA